ncbi:RND family transporter [Mycobacterium sp. 96-892]|uniref:MMPL/RND family transporter n=2 Tax=unclassified Mycobacterium TaxID=2642494 RepID=UPI000992F9F7|nr:RND family transporter [Mycobacterium sp. 96-892]
MSHTHMKRPLFAKIVRKLSIPIMVLWVLIMLALNGAVPPLEVVVNQRAVPLVPDDAPSSTAMIRIGELFKESDSNSVAMIVLEGENPLGDEAHRYYDNVLKHLSEDREHVQYIMDLWGNPTTAAGNQSADGKASYVLIRLAGSTGAALGNESIDAVREIVSDIPLPQGLKSYVTGAAPLATDSLRTADESLNRLMLATLVMITAILLIVYRSIATALTILVTVIIELMSSRGIAALFGNLGVSQVSAFTTSMLVSLVIGAGTDYGIFLFGRYQEARQRGEDRESAYYTAFSGVVPVILGSGLAIAGATFCLSFTRLNYFRTMGIPSALGMLVAVSAALTLGPALLTVGSRFGWFDAKRPIKTRRWRRIGTSVVRWPVPILVASCAAVLVGVITLPTLRISYNEREHQPSNTLSNFGYQAADRHFPQSKLSPEMLLIESDHDLRNSTDMLALDRVAKNVFRVPGVAMVQSVTRPLGTPLENTSLPFSLGYMGSKIGQNMRFIDDRMADMTKMSDTLTNMLALTRRMQALTNEQAAAAAMGHDTSKAMRDIAGQMRDQLATADDFFRPLRNYFYWEKNCFNIPICGALRSVFDLMDGLDKMVDEMDNSVTSSGVLASALPKMADQFGNMLDNTSRMQTLLLTMQSTFQALMPQFSDLAGNMRDLGRSFDAAKNDDFFYLPPEAFDNPDFQIALKFFVSPDGKSARYIVTHQGEAMSKEGIERAQSVYETARESVKGTTLAGANVYIGGSATNFWDIKDGAKYDLVIAAIAALALIFIIMLVIIRSFAAAIVILGTVVFSFAGAFGLSVLIWQHLLGKDLNWLVLPISFIILVAVGSDYNLLLISRLKEEVSAGFKTGLVRAMGGTGGVVTTAGVVFAFTMLAMVVSDLRTVGQVGSTICIGLLLDTLVVRAFMVPAIARLLGRWFWWPQRIDRVTSDVPSRLTTVER